MGFSVSFHKNLSNVSKLGLGLLSEQEKKN